jgi:hypothetical protein
MFYHGFCPVQTLCLVQVSSIDTSTAILPTRNIGTGVKFALFGAVREESRYCKTYHHSCMEAIDHWLLSSAECRVFGVKFAVPLAGLSRSRCEGPILWPNSFLSSHPCTDPSGNYQKHAVANWCSDRIRFIRAGSLFATFRSRATLLWPSPSSTPYGKPLDSSPRLPGYGCGYDETKLGRKWLDRSDLILAFGGRGWDKVLFNGGELNGIGNWCSP